MTALRFGVLLATSLLLAGLRSETFRWEAPAPSVQKAAYHTLSFSAPDGSAFQGAHRLRGIFTVESPVDPLYAGLNLEGEERKPGYLRLAGSEGKRRVEFDVSLEGIKLPTEAKGFSGWKDGETIRKVSFYVKFPSAVESKVTLESFEWIRGEKPSPAVVLFDFPKDAQGWTGREGVKVEWRAAEADHPLRSIRLSGTSGKAWNYARSASFPLAGKAGPGKVELVGRILVHRSDAPELGPFFKCEYLDAKGASLGRGVTAKVDAGRNAWQESRGTLEIPVGAVQVYLAVEKGADRTLEADIEIADLRFEKATEEISTSPIHVEPASFALPPELLRRIPETRPRLFFMAEDFRSLSKEIGGTRRKEWEILKSQADSHVRTGPPAYQSKEDSSGKEQLWQREVGNSIVLLALAWKLSGDRAYLESAEAWAKASCEYATWGLGKDDGMDLAASHQMFGLAVLYDWAFADLGAESAERIRSTLSRRCGAMFHRAVEKKVWWHSSFLQNHLWNDAMGMAIAGFALARENPEADQWIGYALDRWKKTIACLGEDGASHEGEPYWEYGMDALVKFMIPAKRILGVDFFRHPWFSNTSRYALHMTLPRSSWTKSSSVLDFGDSPRNHWYGPDHVLFAFAREARDPVAQWLAEEVQKAEVNAPRGVWLNFAARDLGLKPVPPEGAEPPDRHFDDLGIVTSRSSWRGDESLLAFKCGPYVGRKGVEISTRKPPQDLGAGHVHPDANHLTLFGEGDMLLSDDGYAEKWTANHNTLLVDGRGQMGEGRIWFDAKPAQSVGANPHLRKVSFSPGSAYLVGDATEAYPASFGLRKFHRHVFFAKPDAILVVDEVELAEAKPLELRFFPESQNRFDGADGSVVFPGVRSLLRFTSLGREEARLEVEPVERKLDRHGKSGGRLAIRILQDGKTKWRSVSVFSWSGASASPADASLLENGNVIRVRIGSKIVTVNPSAETASVAEASSSAQPSAKGSDAGLAWLAVNGRPVPGFTADGKEYEVARSWVSNEKPVLAVARDLSARIVVTQPSLSEFPSIARVEVVSADGRETSRTSIRVLPFRGAGDVEVRGITGSPDGEGSPAVVLDGDPETYWSAAGRGVWLTLELAKPTVVKGLALAAMYGDKRSSRFEVFASMDGAEWTSLWKGQSGGKTAAVERYRFDRPMKARFVKVVGDGNTVNDRNSFSEVGLLSEVTEGSSP